jgi:hypothetical protein
VPAPDATGTTNLSASAGKLALVATTTALAGVCPTRADIVDFVGYGSLTTNDCFRGTGVAPDPSHARGDAGRLGLRPHRRQRGRLHQQDRRAAQQRVRQQGLHLPVALGTEGGWDERRGSERIRR